MSLPNTWARGLWHAGPSLFPCLSAYVTDVHRTVSTPDVNRWCVHRDEQCTIARDPSTERGRSVKHVVLCPSGTTALLRAGASSRGRTPHCRRGAPCCFQQRPRTPTATITAECRRKCLRCQWQRTAPASLGKRSFQAAPKSEWESRESGGAASI